jgi:hypothetical protein
MFNNDRFGTKKDAQRKHFFNYEGDFGAPIPPPEDYFLLNNDGDQLIDNSDEPLLV